MWIELSCARCGLLTHVNSRGTCKVCRSIHVYKAARRVKEIDVSKAPNAYLWEPDPNGKDRVMVDDGRSIQQENGTWFKVQGTKIILERYDRRRTARPNPAWAFLDRRNRRIG